MQLYDEACYIVALTKNYIEEEKLKELLIKLDEDVGKKSSNEITKTLLATLRSVVDKPAIPPPLWLWFAFYLLVIIHILLVVGIILSFFLLPFYAPWYIALPCMVFIWFFSTSKIDCKLTNLENEMRKTLGLKKIGGFVGHYFIKPVKIMLKMKRRR